MQISSNVVQWLEVNHELMAYILRTPFVFISTYNRVQVWYIVVASN